MPSSRGRGHERLVPVSLRIVTHADHSLPALGKGHVTFDIRYPPETELGVELVKRGIDRAEGDLFDLVAAHLFPTWVGRKGTGSRTGKNMVHLSDDFRHIILRHGRIKRDGQASLIVCLASGTISPVGAIVFSVIGLQVHGDIVDLGQDAPLPQPGHEAGTVHSELPEINQKNIEMKIAAAGLRPRTES